MSTDPQKGIRRFRMLLWGSTGIFALLVVGLVGLNLTQGPRLAAAQLNVQSSVERAGQRLLLQANELIAPVAAEQVSVTPATPVTTTTSDTGIQVEFTGILSYNTTYTVTATGVKSTAQDAASTFTYSFTTPDAEVYHLVPGVAGADDRIVRSSLTAGSGSDGDTVYSAAHIRRFAVLSKSLVVATTDPDGNDLLDIVPFDGSASIPVQLAGPGTVTGLTGAASSNLFGYTFRPAPSPFYPTTDDQLYVYDITLGQAFSIPVSGPDHELIPVSSWRFVPGTTSLVVQQNDGALFVVDALGLLDGSSGAVAAGSAERLLGFVPGTKTLVTEAGGAAFATDFGTPGAPVTTGFALAGGAGGSGGAGGGGAGGGAGADSGVDAPHPLDGSGAAVELGPSPDTVDRVDGSGSSTLFTAPAGTAIAGLCVSTNGRYAVVETAPPSTPDVVTSTYIEIAGGEPPRAFKGSQPAWCSAG
ncbi:hypothetical protein [Subtercola sp. Z020]|uniref:Ig-like domain-containing protein n=1 Tax=Subtercola sp. Z020 TaxID=2080582 RepID=UPI0011B0DDE3|nr:hypothetical protein [Subtercola sp. Z020]